MEPFKKESDSQNAEVPLDGTTEFEEEVKVPMIGDENDSNESKKNELDQCQWIELLSAIFAGFVFIGFHYIPSKSTNAIYIALIAVMFGSYVIYKMRKFGVRVVAEDWGLTLNNFKISFQWCTVVGIIGIAVMMIYKLIFQTGLPFHYDLILMLLLYPIWGVMQQFLVQAMVGLNLFRMGKLPIYVVYLLTACSFTLVHFPHWMLMIATFAMGFLMTPIYLKYKCLYPLGIYHGWCGAIFYWLVLESDPMKDFR